MFGQKMIVDCISDLHGYYPHLEGGDLLIVAGDLTARDTPKQWEDYLRWQSNLPYRKIVFIAGNHDNHIRNLDCSDEKVTYLCDSGIVYEGLKIWGSPWTLKFLGMNPYCMAFACDTEAQLYDKWTLIPNDVDILITHSPPYGILDQVEKTHAHVGSTTLRDIFGRIKPRLWVVGHIHEGYGECDNKISSGHECHFVNASYVNELYEPVNKPVRLILKLY